MPMWIRLTLFSVACSYWVEAWYKLPAQGQPPVRTGDNTHVTAKVEGSLLQTLPECPSHSTQSTPPAPIFGFRDSFLSGGWEDPVVGLELELLTLQPVLMGNEEDINHTESAVAPSPGGALSFIHALTETDLEVILANVHHHTCDPGSHACTLLL